MEQHGPFYHVTQLDRDQCPICYAQDQARAEIQRLKTDLIVRDAREVSVGLPDGRWVPARSYAFNQLRFFGRLKAAWLVFTGRADAVTYPGQ